ncbi:hypothetical protein B0H15DRAFT_147684 [Mycena belliarum]|uniref:Uncharacterized protein n=1 Tax=Mycena belliarum TaxID=1033014 RepID=A0AAD6UDV0_9AGAR|nr:hypothetical protein B0H15DRAFT_147684 [Mycena belliae]
MTAYLRLGSSWRCASLSSPCRALQASRCVLQDPVWTGRSDLVAQLGQDSSRICKRAARGHLFDFILRLARFPFLSFGTIFWIYQSTYLRLGSRVAMYLFPPPTNAILSVCPGLSFRRVPALRYRMPYSSCTVYGVWTSCGVSMIKDKSSQ